MTFYVAQGIIYVVIYDWLVYCHEEYYATWTGVFLCLIAYLILIVPLCHCLDKYSGKK